MEQLGKHIIKESATLNESLKQLNEHSSDVLLLFVVDEEHKLVGSLTDGDIRRGLIDGVKLSDPILKIMFKEFVFAHEVNFEDKIKSLDIDHIKLLPIVDKDGVLINVVNLLTFKLTLPIEAFIMAGGEGQRLRPLTEKTPKPLLMVGDKPIIEHNIDRLAAVGVNRIHISIKYLGNQLKDYFGNGNSKKIDISYVEEEIPMGTVGSVSLINNFQKDTILLMNSDLLTNIDFGEMYNEFIKQNADFMVATIPYKINVPYAVMQTSNGRVTSFQEKPTYTYQSNAGIYLFKKEMADLIPKDHFFNATDLMEKIIEAGKLVTYYPILGYWLDIGKHEDYNKAQRDISHIKF